MSLKNKYKILVAAGGTGGHLFPAMAVVSEIEKILPDCEFTFTGRADKIEGDIIPKSKYHFLPIDVRGLTKKISVETLKLPFRFYNAYKKVTKYIRQNNYDAVICAGAYISYSPAMAAYRNKIPLFLLEANVNPGKTINALSDKASLIFTSFDESKDYFKDEVKSIIRYVGNPVRNELLALPERTEALKKFVLENDKKTILIFGGSLGAKSINSAVKELIGKLDDNVQIIWQTGKLHQPDENLPENVKQMKFINDMSAAYACADLVVSRSGATTVAELEVVGKPSILVPLPSASNNEQYHNAKVLQDNNAGIIINDKDLSDKFVNSVMELINDTKQLEIMSENAKILAKPDAAQKAAEMIINELGKNG